MRKRSFPWIILFMLAIAALVVFGLSALRNAAGGTIPPEETTLPPVTQPALLNRAGLLRHHYMQLTAAEQQAYNIMLERLPGFPESIPVDHLSDESLSRVFTALVLDQPMLFQISTIYYKKTTNSAGEALAFLPEYRMSQAEYAARCEALANVIKTFSVPQYGSEYERELALHDQLVRHCSYSDTAEQLEKSTVYGALVEKSASCEGYARAMQLLLSTQNIECYIITGEATNLAGVKGGHAWNKVRIDGDWYHLDSTWNDPITEDGRHITSHAYFNVNDEQLKITNEINDLQNPCTATKANYFVREGLIYTEISRSDEAAIAYAIRKAVANGDNAVEVRFSDAIALENGLDYLFTQQHVYRILNKAEQAGAPVKTDTVYHADLSRLNMVRILPEEK